MELLALILVNIVTLTVAYVVFSVRIRILVERARKEPLVRELRENIEVAMEYLGTSVELMDRKNRTFYQLVQRADQIATRLEEAIVAETAAQTKTRRRRSKVSKQQVPAPAPPDVAAVESPARAESKAGPPAEQTPPSEDGAVERLLRLMGEDSFEADAALRQSPNAPDAGALGSKAPAASLREGGQSASRSWDRLPDTDPVPGAAGAAGSGAGFFGKGLGGVGRFFGRLMGLRTADPEQAQTGLLRPYQHDFGQTLDGTRHRIEQEKKAPPPPSGPSKRTDRFELSDEADARLRPGLSSIEYARNAKTDLPQKEPGAEKTRAENRAVPKSTAPDAVVHAQSNEATKSNGAGVQAPVIAAPDPSRESARDDLGALPIAPGRTPLSITAGSGEVAVAPDAGASELGPALVPADRSMRREFIRSLLEQGRSPEFIAARTRISMAEIELTAALPTRTVTQRRQRRTEE